MWLLPLVVPIAVLLAALLLQQLEAKLLRAPEPVEHPEYPVPQPTDAAASPAFGPPPDPATVRPRSARPSAARATA